MSEGKIRFGVYAFSLIEDAQASLPLEQKTSRSEIIKNIFFRKF